MLDLLTIALEAHSDERNHHRRYEVSVGRDLLDHWDVTVRYGRVGSPLRELRFGEADMGPARALVHDRLSRRLSAPRRLGCCYRMTGLATQPDIEWAAWIEPKLFDRLHGNATQVAVLARR